MECTNGNKRPEPGEEPEQITLDVKDENSGTTISIDTVISPKKDDL